jgi:hypothetical protein
LRNKLNKLKMIKLTLKSKKPKGIKNSAESGK